MLMVGPPGSGKSMLASRLPGIIPELDNEEILHVNMVASVAGELVSGKLRRTRPFRDPHHSCSMAAMVGGGRNARPGEITLAHNGVLFLDELPEFPRNVLDSLRQPTETGKVTVSRVNAHVTYPARFQLVAAMNPCRCGYLSDPGQACNKAPKCAVDYQSKISGPLLDRMDIHIDVPAVPVFELDKQMPKEGTEEVRKRVEAAREIQRKRYANANIKVNAEADGEVLTNATVMEASAKALLREAVEKMNLSMRGYTRVLRVARTIADLAGEAQISRMHIAEALSYRQARLKA
jgi:magnesium chelatase family protein